MDNPKFERKKIYIFTKEDKMSELNRRNDTKKRIKKDNKKLNSQHP